MRTKTGLPKHCSWNLDREHGKRRVRFRKGGFSTYLPGTPWSEEFMRAYAAALDGVKEAGENVGGWRVKAGTFNALALLYYRSPGFPALKETTKKKRRRTIERFRAEHGDKPLRLLERR